MSLTSRGRSAPRNLLAALTTLALLLAALLTVPLTAPQPVHAESNGVGQKPALGWSSWSYLTRKSRSARQTEGAAVPC
ncbi:hypothetical protein EDD99_0421 [Streptomyces sp. 846.5]|nr:hypothetical protein [Streptomyces sp. 846.5]TDU02036.1 hypothetical protein EDD99_0421 [Streptomyces sp. 846.5]